MTGIVVFVVAVLVVLATSLFKNVTMADRTKALIATVLSVVGGVVTVFGANGWDFNNFDGGDVLQDALLVFGASQLIYEFILKNTSADAALEDVNVIPTGDK